MILLLYFCESYYPPKYKNAITKYNGQPYYYPDLELEFFCHAYTKHTTKCNIVFGQCPKCIGPTQNHAPCTYT